MKELLKSFFKEAIDNLKKDVKKETPKVIADGIITTLFYHRHQTKLKDYFSERWFSDFHFQKEYFRSEKNILAGSYFYKKDFDKDKIIIFSPAYGKGYHQYLDFIYALTRYGYVVFSYDMTAVDESEGKGIKGFPQAILDLEEAIRFVKKDRGIKDDKLILIGEYSGAYAVGAIAKDHPLIPKIVLISPFNSGSDLLKMNGYELIHENIKPYIKYIDHHDEKCFGPISRYTVSKSMRYSKGEFLVIQSSLDLISPLETGMNLFKAKLPKWKRINYLLLEDKTHDEVLYNKQSLKAKSNAFKKYSSESKNPSSNKLLPANIESFRNYFDESVYLNLLDKNILSSIINFISK